MAAAKLGQGFRYFRHFGCDDVTPHLAVLGDYRSFNRTIGINRVTGVDEKIRLGLAHGLVDFHPAEIRIDSPSLASGIPTPQETDGATFDRRRTEVALNRLTDYRVIGQVFKHHAHEDFAVLG